MRRPLTAADRRGWTRLSPPGRKLETRWRHDASGWEVRHCGHPTANWPYHAVDPAHPEALVVTHNGRGFRDLRSAFGHVAAMLAGKLTVEFIGSNRYGEVRCLMGPPALLETLL